MNNAISWFEIPATDLGRATKFYEDILGIQLIPMDLPNIKMRLFPIDDMQTGVGGAIVDSGGFHIPSATDGPLIYLNANPDVQNVLDKVTAAGGTIVVPKTMISPENGYMAVILDPEGNRIAFIPCRTNKVWVMVRYPGSVMEVLKPKINVNLIEN